MEISGLKSWLGFGEVVQKEAEGAIDACLDTLFVGITCTTCCDIRALHYPLKPVVEYVHIHGVSFVYIWSFERPKSWNNVVRRSSILHQRSNDNCGLLN